METTNLNIKVSKEDNIVVIELEGDLDLYNAEKLKKEFYKAIDENIKNIIVSFAKVEYIDSSGVGALLHGHMKLKKTNGRLHITNVYGSVKKLFELTQISHFLNIFETTHEAIRRIRNY